MVISAELPQQLARGQNYWMVLRYERQKVPSAAAIGVLAERLDSIYREARRRQVSLAGLQLDIDAPTQSLPEYAAFLRRVRKVLPNGMQLSITALLDWFRDGTALPEVIKETDEFVPQFYDVSDKSQPRGINLRSTQSSRIRPIAAKIDHNEWAARFNKFGKQYRVGISSFGRSAVVTHPAQTWCKKG